MAKAEGVPKCCECGSDILSCFAHVNTLAVNKYFRAKDESQKWPVCGKFNVTERAIKQARLLRKEGDYYSGAQYAELLDHLISIIVNKEV